MDLAAHGSPPPAVLALLDFLNTPRSLTTEGIFRHAPAPPRPFSVATRACAHAP
jgi:hypothetical protein